MTLSRFITVRIANTFLYSLFFLPLSVNANNLGTIGSIYSIDETDLLTFIQSKIRLMKENGQLNAFQKTMQQSASFYRDRPTPVSRVTTTIESNSFLFDPSIILDHDIVTPDGKLIAMRGTQINPLVFVPLSKTLLFYNADDARQRRWASHMDKRLKEKDKIILVKGSVLSEEKRLRKNIYFDQGGAITSRFHIGNVPCTVSQEGVRLKITESVP